MITPYGKGERRPLAARPYAIAFPQPTMTAQSFRDECDINTIVNQWQRTGDFAHLNKRKPSFGDFTGAVDFQEAMELVDQAELGFSGLGAKVRDRFHNNPLELMEFLEDPENQEEAATLGLAAAPPEPDPAPAPDPVTPPGGEPAPPGD